MLFRRESFGKMEHMLGKTSRIPIKFQTSMFYVACIVMELLYIKSQVLFVEIH